MSLPDKIITYSLIDQQQGSSNPYYQEVKGFTDRVIEKAAELGGDVVDNYHRYLVSQGCGSLPSHAERLLEFLILGILWKTYLPRALESNWLVEKSLLCLTKLRQRYSFLRRILDPFRGLLATSLLRHFDHTSHRVNHDQDNALYCLKRLLAWLAATGEFKQEILRLNNWYTFLAEQPLKTQQMHIHAAFLLADWFKENSEVALGKYTANVEEFIRTKAQQHQGSEDVVLCNRRRIEYHLNMVGAEILNRDYRSDYCKAKRRLVLLPSCMKQDGARCKAENTAFGDRCVGCHSDCNVGAITRLIRNDDVEVRTVYHESSLNSQGAKGELGPDTAIIGVACILHLISGGWKIRGMGIPAQCVLLDHCGCKNHWDDNGIMTKINTRKLEEVLTAQLENEREE